MTLTRTQALDPHRQKMHNLLELIKKEQNIYNIVFHELIRQTSIECVERGELLAELRNKYSDLLNKVPQQIMSLHEEVMAQRALDRRLTDELMRFKGTIGVLTSELTEVKEHDKKVTKEAQKAQQDLRSALAESQKNASLLAEYHDLYELQRRRLERQVFMLSEEREIWSTAAYSLALKVTEEYQLSTAKRLQLSEKGWVKMANHFTILLSDRDTDLLTKIQGFVENWRDLIEDFNIALKQREDEMRESLRGIRSGVEEFLKTFQQKYLDQDGGVIKKPEDDFARNLVGSIKSWDEAIIRETDVFGGDSLLNNQEELSHIRREMEGWTDNALKVFSRHRGTAGKTHPDQVAMLAMNEEVDQLLTQFQHRITGENGVAGLIIHLQSALENWETRLMSSLQGVLNLQESDWGSLYQALEDWLASLGQAVEYVGTTQKDEDRQDGRPHSSIDIHDVVRKTQKWATTASNSIDSEDAKLVEQVSSLHSEMIRWMVQVLLRLAPDKEGNSKESNEMALLGSASVPQLTEVAKTLFESLETFSNYVRLCCNGIVMENTQARQDNNEDNADHELKDLQRLRSECDDWVQTAQILMSQLTGESIEELFPARASTTLSKKPVTPAPENRVAFVDMEKLGDSTARQESTVSGETKEEGPTSSEPDASSSVTETATADTRDGELTSESDEAAAPPSEPTHPAQPDASESNQPAPPAASAPAPKAASPAKPAEQQGEKIEVLGFDSQTHKHMIEAAQAQALGTVPVNPGVDGSPDTKKAFEALAAVQTLQIQLLGAEERAQLSEERASQAEADIVDLEEKVRALEKQLEKQAEQLEKQGTQGPAKSATPSQVTSAAGGTAPSPAHTDSPRAQSEGKDEKSGRKSGRSSGKSSKKNK
ncbi:axonemal dynein light chain domain-containing protein 1 isoform X2 [Aplysia californica]|uniref:Axonemal dynein light chain domain-containing protein 1 isoform X2 n=1 Tax=Aplysia californica TaxID=6500 RepID=A0ABM1A7R2_APLCA|nr:axonemal dynein light chain domain-containing protein 1 isoform X2 [Aplysia californica]